MREDGRQGRDTGRGRRTCNGYHKRVPCIEFASLHTCTLCREIWEFVQGVYVRLNLIHCTLYVIEHLSFVKRHLSLVPSLRTNICGIWGNFIRSFHCLHTSSYNL